jgi:cell division protein FtsL
MPEQEGEARSMNAQLSFAQSRHFRAGVGTTVVAGILVWIGVPNLLRSRIYPYRLNHAMHVEKTAAIGGGGGGGDQDRFMAALSISGYDDERKMIRNACIDLIVERPKEASDNIRKIAKQAGGFLLSAEVYGGENASIASLTVRVPVEKFEDVRAQITKLGIRIESEKLEAQDVTKQYIDLSARLRNLRGQEGQYLGILKQARTVKDTVEVSDKLNEVRAQIEQQQAEFDTFSKQVETVALSVTLRAEADVRVLGLQWRPLYRLKESVRDGIDGIGDYASATASFIFFIPALLLWIATILAGAAIAWRILRWAGKVLFKRKTLN